MARRVGRRTGIPLLVLSLWLAAPAVASLTAWSAARAAAQVPAQTATRATARTPAAATAKRPLQIADYALWRTIEHETISDDGRRVAWTYRRVRGDDTLHVRSLDDDTGHLVARGSEPLLSSDGRWMAFFVSLPYLEIEKLEADDETVTRRAGLMDLESGTTLYWDDATSFGFSESASHFFVKKRRPEAEGGGGGSGGGSGRGRGADDRPRGSDLILRNLAEGFEELIGSVDEAAFNEPGTHFAFTVDAAGGDGNGLYLVDLASGARRGLDNSKLRYARLAWSEDGSALAALRGERPEGRAERANELVAFRGVGRALVRHLLAATGGGGLPDGWVISEKGELVWSAQGSAVFLATRRQQDELEPWPEDALPLADVNIWHWNDDRIQSQQQQSAQRDRERTYVAAVHLDGDAPPRLVPIADERMATAEVGRDGRWAIARDDHAYASDWKPDVADYWRVDTRTGERTPVLTEHLRTLGLSPDGRHWLYWKDGHVWDYEIASDRHRNLTGGAPTDFTNQEYDRFGEKPPHGVAGWSADGRAVLLHDRTDLWRQPLDGSPATSLTGGRGAEREMRLRYLQLDPDELAVDLSRPLLLSAFGEKTKQAGFFSLERGRLSELTYEDRRFGTPVKAEDAERYLFTAESWTEFPDLQVSDGDFAERRRVTVANPWQEEFAWGTRILFDYTLADGVPLQGTLAIPDGWQPGQRLPMVVRFYEKYSQDLHAHPTPAYRHQPNFAGYVSNGYLLMQPDVHFRIGSSHSDMLEAVEAATRKVIEMGYADPAAVGLSGHSYSGGGSAYIATRSRMFAAVAHGAAPINLVSEFNQLFVGNGQNNHQYDIYGQGRYATDPYSDFQLYWDQSPISGVTEMDTPVLYLHGEEDPTVNWEQGLEWFNALRFLGKPVIWLSYPDEGHGLAKLQNRIDFQYRLGDFFDHHLKGAPAPEWMTEGVPYLEKERHMREYTRPVFGPAAGAAAEEAETAGATGSGSAGPGGR